MSLRRAHIAPALALALAGSGCSSGPASDSMTPASAASAASTAPSAPAATGRGPSPELTEEPLDLDSLMIPTCEELLAITKVQTEFHEDAEYFDLDVDVPLSQRMPSAEANDAMAQAVASADCLWGLPESDVGFSIDVAFIPDDARDPLVDSLREGGFEESDLGAAHSFTEALDGDSGLWVTLYTFDGPVWVTYIGMGRSETASELVSVVLENLAEANPQL